MSPRRSPSEPSLFVAVIVASAPGLLACGSRTAVLEEQGGSSESGAPDGGTGVEDSGGGGPDATFDTGAVDAGTCPAGDTACGGACVDEQTDLANCGGCGMACGGTCTAGRCLVTLAKELDIPTAIALDATSVYLTTGDPGPYVGTGGVLKIPLGGGTPVTLATPGESLGAYANGAYGKIQVEGTSVYWMPSSMAGPSIMKVPVGGGTAATLVAPSVATYVADFAVRGPQLYWTQDPCNGGLKSNCTGIGQVMSEGLNGGTPFTVVSYTGSLGGLAVDATHVYWVDPEVPQVLEAPVSGGSATVLAAGCAGSSPSLTFGVDATGVFCSDDPLGVETVPLTGGAPTIYTAQGGAPPVTTDATSIYWAAADPASTSGNMAIFKAPRGGGTAELLVSGAFTATAIAVDATSVYWTNAWDEPMIGGTGTVLKLTPK